MFRNRYLNIGEPRGLNKSVFIKKLSKACLVVLEYFGSLWVVVGRCGSFWVRCGSLWMVVGRFGSFWVVLGRFGSFWVVPRLSNYHTVKPPHYSSPSSPGWEPDFRNARFMFDSWPYQHSGS